MIDSAITALGAGVLLFCCSFKGDRSPEMCQTFLNVDTLRSECNNLMRGTTVLQDGLTLEETAHGKGVEEGEDALTEFSFKRNVRCKCRINETDNAIAHCKMFSKHLTVEEGDIMCRAFLPAEQFGFVSMGGPNEDFSSDYREHRYRQDQRDTGNHMKPRPRRLPPRGPHSYHHEREHSDDRSRHGGPMRERRGPPPGLHSRYQDDEEFKKTPDLEGNATETTANPDSSNTTTLDTE